MRHLLEHDANSSRPLLQGGDFRSQECIEILTQADIVVTNPPFSLFLEFVALLVAQKKEFLIIGNTNAAHYKEIFKLIKENKFRTGYTMFNVGMFFMVPDDWEQYHHIDEKTGRKLARVSTSCWWTNIDVAKHHDFLPLFKKYTPEEYPTYDNLNAIEVSKVVDIPCDFYGLMGVPDTFLDKFNPDQFELVGIPFGNSGKEIGVTKNFRGRTDIAITKDGKSRCPYSRIIIKRREISEKSDD